MALKTVQANIDSRSEDNQPQGHKRDRQRAAARRLVVANFRVDHPNQPLPLEDAGRGDQRSNQEERTRLPACGNREGDAGQHPENQCVANGSLEQRLKRRIADFWRKLSLAAHGRSPERFTGLPDLSAPCAAGPDWVEPPDRAPCVTTMRTT